MFSFIFIMFSIVAHCIELEQTLVFGKDSDGQHYCDFNLAPPQKVNEVTIFQVINDKDNTSVPRCRLIPTGSPNEGGFSRIDIPSNLAVEGVKYGFQFNFDDDEHAFSEKWGYDPSKKQFAHSYAISYNFFKDPKVLIGGGLLSAVIVAGSVGMIYRSCKKSSRNAL